MVTTGKTILESQPQLLTSTPRTGSVSDQSESEGTKYDPDAFPDSKEKGSTLYDVTQAAPLAPGVDTVRTPGDALLHFLKIRKDPRWDPGAIATRESVFDGPLASHYRPDEKWENHAYFDPAFRWTVADENKVRRKADLKIFLWILLMFVGLNMVRSNLTNATADNLLHDLGITQGDYNLGNSLFRIGFLVAELPSQVIGKKLGVDIWLPIQMCIFSLLSAAQFWMKGRTSFLTFRFLIAMFQGGFIPDVILYLSYFYTKNELPLRLAVFWCVNSSTNVLNGLLAVGILEMRGLGGHAGWQYYFLIVGLITFTIGVASFFMLAPGPSQTAARWRPNGYFTDKEVKIVVNKVIRDDPSKSSMGNRDGLTPKLMWRALCDYDLWPMYIIGLTFGIAGYPVSNYFQISMRSLGFNTLMSNLLSIPHTFITIITLLGITVASEIFNSRTILATLENWWFLPFFIALRTLPDPISPWTYFTLATLLLGYPYAHALQVAWCSRNAGSVRTRTVSAAVYNMFVQASGIIGANLYQASDKPRYYRGNSIILGIIAPNLIIIYPGTYFYYKWRNAQKEKVWSKMSIDERSVYLATTTDEGCKRLDFRFAY